MGGAVPFEGFWINTWIERRAELSPSWVALADDAAGGVRRVVFRELSERARRVAGYMRSELGVGRGDVVAMLSWGRVEVLEVLFACSRIGAIFAPLNVRLAAPELTDLAGDVQPKALFFEGEHARKAKAVAESLGVRELVHIGEGGFGPSVSYLEAVDLGGDDSPELVGLEDPVMLLQTGGTTGRPKWGVVTHRMVFWNALNTLRDLTVPGDATITAVPLFHIGGYTYTLPLLLYGGVNFIMHRWSVDRFIELVERERPTFLFLVPAQLKMLVESPRFWEADFTSVRWITSGGAALTPELIRAVMKKGVVQKQGFGMTEMGPGVFALDPWDAERKMGSIGKPNLLVEARVVKDGEVEASPGEEGELLLRGPSLFGGYWRMPEETERALRGGWLHTGDVVKRDDEGYFYVVGRRKHVIRSGSESIYPEEVERVLLAHPKVEEAVVIGVPDPKWGEVPKALVVLRRGEKLTKEELAEFCEGKIARYKIPKYLQVLDEIPKSPLGKVSRAALAELYGKPEDSY